MIRKFIAWTCRLAAPQAFSLLRWMERVSGASLQALPGANLPAAAVRAGRVDPLWVLMALASGPGVDSIVSPDGTIIWQAGQALQTFHNLPPSGWTGQRLPPGSQTLRIVRGVLGARTATRYDIVFEGIHYTGVAYPIVDGQGAVCAVVLRSVPALWALTVDPTAQRGDQTARLALLQELDRAARNLPDVYAPTSPAARYG